MRTPAQDCRSSEGRQCSRMSNSNRAIIRAMKTKERKNAYLARGVLDEDVRVDEVEVELEVLELLLELEELVEEDVVAEEDCVEVVCGELLLESVDEVVGDVLTGKLLKDED
jgi:hypothetical protein